ncbi:hypothetical protein QBC44DRAFT_306359 [Cladorrhinum sp. PSN332]|nr:hypothetical protein QBC44DRAFT_306359 [Cladorrhinum sp. PSN332]
MERLKLQGVPPGWRSHPESSSTGRGPPQNTLHRIVDVYVPIEVYEELYGCPSALPQDDPYSSHGLQPKPIYHTTPTIIFGTQLNAGTNCQRPGHALSQCIKSTSRGDIQGCPICETSDHLIDTCPTKPTKKQIWERLGPGRARRPPMRSKEYSWVQVGRYGPNPGSKGLRAGMFPWSRKFATRWAESNPDGWRFFGYTAGMPRLPVDPETRDWDRAIEWDRKKRAVQDRKKRKRLERNLAKITGMKQENR